MDPIRVILTGATGMVGKGVLFECLSHPSVSAVLCLNRQSLGMRHPKLKEVLVPDFFNLAPVESELQGYEACFFCLGVSSVGMKEDAYSRVTYDLTLNVAQTLLRLNPGMSFCYVSGMGTDSSEKGSSMWARVKGRTENALLALPFRSAYMFRPGYIHPAKGIRSRTRLYNAFIVIFRPFYPLLKRLAPGSVTTSEAIGRAMIAAVTRSEPKKILEPPDINRLGE